jgi:hypothetical protein
MNDFVAGLLLLGFGVFLATSNAVTDGEAATNVSQYLVGADTYLRVLGLLIAALSIVLAVRAINFKKTQETGAFVFVLKLETVLTVILLIIYIILLPKVGFRIITFFLTFFLTCLYMRKEFNGSQFTRRLIIRKGLIALIFSLILVAVVYLIFTKLLKAALP